jgi:hypothetical protein
MNLLVAASLVGMSGQHLLPPRSIDVRRAVLADVPREAENVHVPTKHHVGEEHGWLLRASLKNAKRCDKRECDPPVAV